MALGTKSIYLAIRGINYTDRATREVGKNVDAMIKKQQELRQQGIQLLSAGMMFTALGGMAFAGIMKMVNASVEGHRAMRIFGREAEQAAKTLGSEFFKVLAPLISMLTNLMRVISQNKDLAKFVAILGTIAVALLIAKGASLMLGAGLKFLQSSLVTTNAVATTTSATGLNALTIGLTKLQAALGPIILGFTIGAALVSMFGDNAWAAVAIIGVLTVAISALAIALHASALGLSILTFGAAAVAGGAAMAIAASSTPSFQHGTKYVRKTGPAILHEGEQVISTRDQANYPIGDKSRVGNAYNNGFPTRTTNVNFNGITIQTKADKDELTPLILRVLKDSMDNRV